MGPQVRSATHPGREGLAWGKVPVVPPLPWPTAHESPFRSVKQHIRWSPDPTKTEVRFDVGQAGDN